MATAGWHTASGIIPTSSTAFGLMGILNITPDSFYDGGSFQTRELALARMDELLEGGADIVDVGAESTRPGAGKLNPEEELDRLLPLVTSIRETFPDLIISVDTRNGVTARICLENGMNIINDVSGLRHDPSLLETLAYYQPGYVLTHSKGDPETMQNCPSYKNVVDEIMGFFETRMSMLVRAGLPENRIALDPGIGFAKSIEHNLEIFKNLDQFLKFHRPLLIGLSMKSFFGHLLGHSLHERLIDTSVASVLAWSKGVFWHRVHHVRETRDALFLAEAFSNA